MSYHGEQVYPPREVSRGPVTHDLKTWPDGFEAILRGNKHHEVRPDDRGFRPGDRLQLMEWNPDGNFYTGRVLIVRVTYKTEGGTYGVPEGMCVMSIETALHRDLL